MMGTINHRVMVIVTSDTARMLKAHQKAHELFDNITPGLVSPISISKINGVETFMVATSGSKEGWEPAIEHRESIEALHGWLKDQAFSDGSNAFRWASVFMPEERERATVLERTS